MQNDASYPIKGHLIPKKVLKSTSYPFPRFPEVQSRCYFRKFIKYSKTYFLFMKQNLDNAGVAALQDHVLALLAFDLLLETNLLRTDLYLYVDSRFDLSSSQQQQLQTMSPSLSSSLGQAIANSWEQGVRVDFYKEEKDEDKVPDPKEMTVFGLDPTVANDSQSAQTYAHPLMIRIRYNYK